MKNKIEDLRYLRTSGMIFSYGTRGVVIRSDGLMAYFLGSPMQQLVLEEPWLVDTTAQSVPGLGVNVPVYCGTLYNTQTESGGEDRYKICSSGSISAFYMSPDQTRAFELVTSYKSAWGAQRTWLYEYDLAIPGDMLSEKLNTVIIYLDEITGRGAYGIVTGTSAVATVSMAFSDDGLIFYSIESSGMVTARHLNNAWHVDSMTREGEYVFSFIELFSPFSPYFGSFDFQFVNKGFRIIGNVEMYVFQVELTEAFDLRTCSLTSSIDMGLGDTSFKVSLDGYRSCMLAPSPYAILRQYDFGNFALNDKLFDLEVEAKPKSNAEGVAEVKSAVYIEDLMKNSHSGNQGKLTGGYNQIEGLNHFVGIGIGQGDTNFVLPTDHDWLLMEMTEVNGIANTIGQHAWSDDVRDVLTKLTLWQTDINNDTVIYSYTVRFMRYYAGTGLCDIYEGDENTLFLLEWVDVPFTFPEANWLISETPVVPIYQPRFAGEVTWDSSIDGASDNWNVYVSNGVNVTFIDKSTNQAIEPTFFDNVQYLDPNYPYGVLNDIWYRKYAFSGSSTIGFYTDELVVEAKFDHKTVGGVGFSLFNAEDLEIIDGFLTSFWGCIGDAYTGFPYFEPSGTPYFAPGVFDKVTSAINAFSKCKSIDFSTTNLSFPLLQNASYMFHGALLYHNILGLSMPVVQNVSLLFPNELEVWPADFGIPSTCTNMHRWTGAYDDSLVPILQTIPPGGVDTTNVTDISYAFQYVDLDLWLPVLNLDNVITATAAFNAASSTQNITMVLPNAINVSSLFYNIQAPGLTLDIDIPLATTAAFAFTGNTHYPDNGDIGFHLDKLVLRNPDNITSCQGIFSGSFQYDDSFITQLEIHGVLHFHDNDCINLFRGTRLTSIPNKTKLDFSNATNLQMAFSIKHYEDEDLPIDYDFSNITSLNQAWQECGAIGGGGTKLPTGKEINFPLVITASEAFSRVRLVHAGDITLPACVDLRLLFYTYTDSYLYPTYTQSIGKIITADNCEFNQAFENAASLTCIAEMDTTTALSKYNMFLNTSNLIDPTSDKILLLESEEGYHYVNPNSCPI